MNLSDNIIEENILVKPKGKIWRQSSWKEIQDWADTESLSPAIERNKCWISSKTQKREPFSGARNKDKIQSRTENKSLWFSNHKGFRD